MGDWFSLVKTYTKVARKRMEEFWGFSIRPPKVVIGDRTIERIDERKIFVNEADLHKWGINLAQETSQSEEAGYLYYCGHSVNHFYAYKFNDELYGSQPPLFPDDPNNHHATVEAIVSVATAWLLDTMNYDGTRMVKQHLRDWSDQLWERQRTREVAQECLGSYYVLSKMDRDEFMNFTRKYKAIEGKNRALADRLKLFRKKVDI